MGRPCLERLSNDSRSGWVRRATGAPEVVESLRPAFPGSLNGAPVLLPDRLSSLRNGIEDWFESHDLRPRVVAEIADSALMKTLASDGAGLMLLPDDVKERACTQYGMAELGPADGVRQRFYLLADPGHAELFEELLGSS